MNRNGTTLLTGTLLVTLFLSPGARSVRQTGAALSANTGVAPTRTGTLAGGTTPLCDTASCRERALISIRKEGEEEYREQLDDIIADVCPAQDPRTSKAMSKPDRRRQEKKEADWSKCGAPRNFVIALVPDPIHTHLALMFDRTVDAIAEAVQDEGYIFDRALMPWDRKIHPESDDFRSRLEFEWYQEGKERWPGVMAFRHDKGDKQPLFVLVVSETPTSGVREEQFHNAIEVIHGATGRNLRSCQDWRTDHNNEPGLRIIGPMFSGSLRSLANLLWCPDGKQTMRLVSIHSGSVSSRKTIIGFDRQAQKSGVHFVSLHESDDVMIDRLVEFLTGPSYEYPKSDRGYATREIAILSEDETSYGASNERQKNKPPDCDKDPARHDVDCSLKVFFPREISQLRAAYQDSLTAAPSTAEGRAPPRETLPSNFSVPGSDDDTVAPYSLKQTPLSQESVLLDLVSELRKHRIKLIILRATDPVDSLFLSQFLRTAYPQGRIVTIEADLLFLHEAGDSRLQGMLALATYSPAPTSNHYFASYEEGHAERVFPSSIQAGTYNATRSLMKAWVTDTVNYDSARTQDDDTLGCGCRHVLGTYKQASASDHKGQPMLYQYGWLWERFKDGQSARRDSTWYDAPPVRLLALGRDDYWLIASLGPFRGEKLITTLPRIHNQMSGVLEKVSIPKSWLVVQLVGILLGLAFSSSIWCASLRAKMQGVAKYAPATSDGRMTAVFVGGLAVMLILMILLWPSAHNAKHTPGEANLDGLLKFTLGVVVLCISVDLVSRTLLSRNDERFSRWKGWSLAIAFLVLFMLMAVQVFFNQPVESEAYLVRFATLRAMQLTSGLSFIMPIFFFLAVWLWWADHATAGFVLLDERRPRLPQELKEPTLQAVTELRPGLRQALLPLSPLAVAKYAAILVMVIYGFWWMGDHSHSLMSLERNLPQGVMWFLLTLAVGGVFITSFRLLEIWIGVRKLLVALDSLPLRRAFKAIKGFSWTPIWLYGAGSLEDSQRIFNRKKEALDRALNTYPLETGDLHKDWLELVAKATAMRHVQRPQVQPKAGTMAWVGKPIVFMKIYFQGWWARREHERDLIKLFGKYQEDVAKIASKALDLLAQSWAREKEEKKRSFRDVRETQLDVGLRAWEHCVCLVYVNFLLAMLVRIRTLIIAIGGMYVLTLIGIAQYPFEPKASIQVLLVVVLVFIVVVVGLVFAQMHRDATLSNITDTTPGELGSAFWIRMVSFMALPVFSLVASQFPSINRFFYSWLQPALQALNR